MYTFVRIVVSLLLIVCLFVALKASRANHKRIFGALSIGTGIAVFIVLLFIPFENGFVTFESPHSVYQYYTGSDSEIELVIEGEQCDLVVDRNGVKETFLIVPKTSDGWKIGIGSEMRKVQQSFEHGILVQVLQYKDTNDYFMIILNTEGGASNISAEEEIEFYTLERYDSHLEKSYISYYAHIRNFDFQTIKVNDNRISGE